MYSVVKITLFLLDYYLIYLYIRKKKKEKKTQKQRHEKGVCRITLDS